MLQMWSYFGATLCSADVNNDGLDDLLVGAPYYTELDKGGNSDKLIFKDEGRVIVYLNIRRPSNKTMVRFHKQNHMDSVLFFLSIDFSLDLCL